MSHRYFENRNQAYFYSKARHVPSSELILQIIAYFREKSQVNENEKWNLAVDVGAGTGQCTSLLQPYFDDVYGFDISEEQINQAIGHNNFSNVHYAVSPSEKLPLEDKSVDLITACQCMHWFDCDLFFKEVQRVLKPNGVLAVIGYTMKNIQVIQMSNVDTHLDANILCNIYNGELMQKYFEVNRLKHLDDGYIDIDFPFKDVSRKQIFVDKIVTAEDCVDYVHSWSGFRRCFEHNPFAASNLLQNLRKEFERCFFRNPKLCETQLILRTECNLILCRK
ncbi:putative methyltransferase-like protein [Leptotrombidium deliense]|uniref:Putative methyltransferase-like protein n=1 Tax=Leptotrombidium deliense TaxID=299467 RepID=A0A443S2T7_9ACAR|nr:putative methyltransferase-like protein [Leptotrombidium deliense]